MKPLNKLFWDEMGEMLHIKELLLKALPRMSAATHRPEFKEALEAYRSDVEQQSSALRAIFKCSDLPARERKCDGMMSVLIKTQQLIQRNGQGPALDAALLLQCQRIVSYNIASYWSLASWAKLLLDGEGESADSFNELLRSEMDASLRFSRLSGECDLEAARQPLQSARFSAPRGRSPAKQVVGSEHSGKDW
jgi:ferritin-like metal-binding protein YciE